MKQKPEFISGPEIPVMRTVHDDERRTIREAESVMPDGRIQRITALAIKQAGVLGDHYHNNPEHFTVLEGNPTILVARKETPGKVHTVHLPKGGYITMEPGMAHAFKFAGKGEMFSTMDGAFDPEDMYPQRLDEPGLKPDAGRKTKN